MLDNLVERIDHRLATVGISGEMASRLAGHEGLIDNIRKAFGCGRVYNPRARSLADLAPILRTTPEWLLDRRGPEEVMPDADTIAKVEKAKKSGRKRKARRLVSIDGIEAPVEIINGDITINGNSNIAASSGARAAGMSTEAAGELLGMVNEAIDAVYRAAGRDLTLLELGRLALGHHTMIIALCQSPEEFPLALEIMKMRIQRALESPQEDGTGPGASR